MAAPLRVFMSPELEVEFKSAYQTILDRWPIPYEELNIPTRYGDTHIIASGSKHSHPLVLLNPGGGSLAIWRYNVEPLSQRYRTYAIDVIGEMNKSIPTRPITNRMEFIEWVSDLFNALEIDSTHVIGNSNGGFFALNIALHLPERVNEVVLISPAATFVPMRAWWWHLLIPAHIIAPLIRSETLVHRAYAWLWQNFPVDEDYARLKFIGAIAGYPRYRPTRNKFAPRVFSDEELRSIKSKVLLLIGDHEVIYRPEKAIQRATNLVPGLVGEIVPNANHCAQYTAPKAVNRRILDFLTD